MMIERCADCWEALTIASMARRNGLNYQIATPRTHGFWGVYLVKALPA